MVIESGARPYVKITGTGRPTLITTPAPKPVAVRTITRTSTGGSVPIGIKESVLPIQKTVAPSPVFMDYSNSQAPEPIPGKPPEPIFVQPVARLPPEPPGSGFTIIKPTPKPIVLSPQHTHQLELQKKPEPIPATKESIRTVPTYDKIYSDISKAKAQVLTSKIPIQQKTEEMRSLTQQEREIKEYQREGFTAKEVMVASELAPGQMGPPAPQKGYEFVVPESAQLEWIKYQTEKSSKLPPVLREVAQFGQGLESSLFSVGAPVAGFLGKSKEYNVATSIAMARGTELNPFDSKAFGKNVSGAIKAGRYGVHYPSTLDIGFERVGMAPKGTTEFLSKNPAFAAGGVGGEVAQFAVGGAVIKGVSKGVKVGARYVLPKIGPTVQKLTTVAGREMPSLSSKIAQTTIGKNVRLFGKGYEPVAKGTESIISSGSAKTTKGLTTISRISREFKLTPNRWFGFAEKEFVPKTLAPKLSKPIVEATNIVRPGEATMLFEQRGMSKGILKGLRKTYGSVKVTAKSKLEAPLTLEIGEGPSKGSLYRFTDMKMVEPRGMWRVSEKLGPLTRRSIVRSGKEPYVPMLESELKNAPPKIKWLYETVIPSQRGKGIPFIAKQTIGTETKKGFIPKKSFVFSSEASGSLLTQPRLTTRFVSTSGRVLKGSSQVATTLPSSEATNVAGRFGAYGTTKVLSKGYTIQTPPKSIIISRTETRPTSAHRREMSSSSGETSSVNAEGNKDLQLPFQFRPTDERRGNRFRFEPKSIPTEREDQYQRSLFTPVQRQISYQEQIPAQERTQRYGERLIEKESGGYGGATSTERTGSTGKESPFILPFPKSDYSPGGGGTGFSAYPRKYRQRSFRLNIVTPDQFQNPVKLNLRKAFIPKNKLPKYIKAR